MDFLAAGNLLVLCPVIAVVAGVVLVFLFGFKQPSQPKKFTSTSDSNKKPKKKDTKRPVTSGSTEKSSSSTEPSRKERSADVAVKKSPTKEANQKKAPVRQENVKTQNKSKLAVKSTKKEKVKAEVVPQKKPDDFDDGSWFTVPTKSEKKRPKLEEVTSSPKPETVAVEQSIVEKKNTKNAKQLKDQANKSKKEAEDAAATSAATMVLQVEKIISVTEPVPKTRSNVLNEEDQQTAEIIEKIHEAIADVVIEPVVVQKQIVSKSISKIVADREEKVDEIKPVETNIAFDELADAWTEAKPTKKNKKKTRKD